MNPNPPEAWEPLLRVTRALVRPLDRFFRIEAASGVLLLLAAITALVWANSPWSRSYEALWRLPIGLELGPHRFVRPLSWVVDDVLMVLFFFVVGLEIRRELHAGELSEWRRAALPVAAALGGMIAPAVVFLALAGGRPTRTGWGVPMATDIAFAVGVVTLLGKRVPPALRVLLLALAVIDDIGAIVVIAAFYSSRIFVVGLVVAAAGVACILAMQRSGVRSKIAYVAPGVVIWAGIYGAGIHPTVAGVVVGLLTPVRAWLGPDGFARGARADLERLIRAAQESGSRREIAETLHRIDVARRGALSPAEVIISSLHPWVAFVIMPLFALANAGVDVSGVTLDGDSLVAASGIAAGLVFGKPVGVVLATAATRRIGLTRFPAGIGFRHIAVLGVVAGVGFTMALFVAQLAYAGSALLPAAKLGVLVASGAAMVGALALGRATLSRPDPAGIAASADEAEASTEL